MEPSAELDLTCSSPAVYGPVDHEGLAKLREHFPPEAIGKLPRVTCSDCSKRDRNCERHTKTKCEVCKNYISTAHIHLDFVGHAGATDRLLTTDDTWTWEPMAYGPDGLPLCTVNRDGNPVGLWIWLYVCGVRRPGYGSVEGAKSDAIKELIGDAIRNAGLRFGIALDLWAKEPLESETSDRSDAAVQRTAAPAKAIDRAQRERFLLLLDTIPEERSPHPTTGELVDNPRDAVRDFLLSKANVSTWADFPADRAPKALEWLEAEAAKYAPTVAPGEEKDAPAPSSPPPAEDPADRVRAGVVLLLEQMTDEQANGFADWLAGERIPLDPDQMTADQATAAWEHANTIIEGATA